MSFVRYQLAMLWLIFLVLLSVTTLANTHPENAYLNYSQKSLSNAGNPAAAALIIERNDPHVMAGGSISISAGLEYGNVDDLFAKLDELANYFKPPKEPSEPNSPPTVELPIRDFNWQNIFNDHPELNDRLDLIKDKVVNTAVLLAIIATEGYAKAEASTQVSFILNKNFYGGTLMFNSAYRGNAKAVGLVEAITFDKAQAKIQLARIPNFKETDPIQELDLSAGIILFYNPANNKVKLTVKNDSLLLIKATKISEISLSYSHKLLNFKGGDLYLGVKPIFYRVGLTNKSIRLGEITDVEGSFNDIRNADYIYQNGLDVDLGLVWATSHYQVGASLTKVFEKTYKFPLIENSRYSSNKILQLLDHHQEFTMQRQLKLEGSIYSAQRHWSLNVALDANPVVDPMRDRYQWLSVTGGYAADSWWLPSARIGFSRNLAGSKLAYINAGVTVMKFINIDIATTLDSLILDGDDYKKGTNMSIGVRFDY